MSMSGWKGIFGKLFSRDRRHAERLPSPDLAAFFWTGAAPVEHGIRDISSTGLYLVTEERWYPGTLVMMTLQKKDTSAESPDRSISIQSKAVRWGDDGVGLEFVPKDGKSQGGSKNLLLEGADRKTLDRFLQDFQSERGSAVINRITPPAGQPGSGSTNS